MTMISNALDHNNLSVYLYRVLFFLRRCEEYIIKHYPEDMMKTPMHMSMGQEAISVAVCRGLDSKGDIFASYRSHASFLAQTLNSDLFFAELYGRITGTAVGKCGSMHLSAPELGHLMSSGIVGSTIAPSLGVAFANKRFCNGRTAVVFFGDGAVDEGVFWESMNAAKLYNLPVFFICEDNNWAVHTPMHLRRGFSSLEDVAKLFGLNYFYDDSNDVEKMYAIVKEAKSISDSNNLPVLLHFRCCRYLEHVGIYEDWELGYRSISEKQEWLNKDSLLLQRERLHSIGIKEYDILQDERLIDEMIQKSVLRATESAVPSQGMLYEGVFYENT